MLIGGFSLEHAHITTPKRFYRLFLILWFDGSVRLFGTEIKQNDVLTVKSAADLGLELCVLS